MRYFPLFSSMINNIVFYTDLRDERGGAFYNMLGTFPKKNPEWQLPNGVFPCGNFPNGIFPSSSFPNVQFHKRQLPQSIPAAEVDPRPILAAALGPLSHPSRSIRPPLQHAADHST